MTAKPGVRQLLAAIAQQYCRSAAWLLAAGELAGSEELVQSAADVLTERSLCREVGDAG